MEDESGTHSSSEDEIAVVEDMEDADDDKSDREEEQEKEQVYLPGDTLKQDEQLVCDQSAYVMYHAAQTGAPCLSFDILASPSTQSDSFNNYPLSMYMVAGTQGERAHIDHIIVMRMFNLTCNKPPKGKKADEESDEEGSDEEEEKEDEKPHLKMKMMKHNGGINRIRHTCVGSKNHLAATWSERGVVNIWDITHMVESVSTSVHYQPSHTPIFAFNGHQTEGFAIDWSTSNPGRLASGDCNKNIHVWNPTDGGTWLVDQRPFTAHTASVEDLQWSPNEPNVFMSCSVDKSIRVWDCRAAPHKACMLTAENAHERDVNVISWNRHEPFIVSGGDDGVLNIWDLRQFQSGTPVAVFKHHTAPITSVEWHPTDSSIFAASGADEQLTLWDLSVEKDDMGGTQSNDEPAVPPQLLFIHQGQTDIKELHWHPQHNGAIVSTAHSGFNIFRTISV